MKKSKRYGGIFGTLAGGVIGGLLGKSLSPNRASEDGNQIMGTVFGSSIGFWAGRKLGKTYYGEDPENFKGPDINLKKNEIKDSGEMIRIDDIDVGTPQISINNKETTKEIYKVSEAKDLPKELRGIAKKQYVIEHKVPKRKVQTKDNRYYITEDFKMYEIFFSDDNNGSVKNEKR